MLLRHATGVLQLALALTWLSINVSGAAEPQSTAVDQILAAYVQAAGGQAAVDHIESREVHAKEHRGPKLIYYWQKPDRVLLVDGKERLGYDGGSGWVLSPKKRLSRLPKGAQSPLEMDVNSLRYTHLQSLYSELDAASPSQIDGHQMDVIAAPNALGSTKFYFDHETHLLARIEEFGETSAYYTHTTDFSDYKKVDGVELPFRILHRTNEPHSSDRDIRISEVQQNMTLAANLFSKPVGGAVVLGGKR